MAHNGAKAGFITSAPPSHSSSIRVCRFIFLAMLVCIVAVSYYCWTTTVNNSMLRDRVDRLARDFWLMRNQRSAADKNVAECKTRLSAVQSLYDSVSQQLKQAKDEITELQNKQEADGSAVSSCEQKLKLLTQQNSDDMKAVTHEVKDCKAKLDNFRDDCERHSRMQELRVLRAVYQLTGNDVLQQLKHKFDIDTTGVEVGVSPLPVQSGQPSGHGPSRAWSHLFLHKSPGSRVMQLVEQQRNRTRTEHAPTSRSSGQSRGGKVDERSGQQAGVKWRSVEGEGDQRLAQARVHRDRGDLSVEQATSSVQEQQHNESIQKSQAQEQQSEGVSGNRMDAGTSESERKQQTAEAREPVSRRQSGASDQTQSGAAADVEDKRASEKNNTDKSAVENRDQPTRAEDEAQEAEDAAATGSDMKPANSTANSQVGERPPAGQVDAPTEADRDNKQEQDDDDDEDDDEEYEVDKDQQLRQ